MSNQFNAVKFFETFAKIIAEREKVEISVTVRRKEEADATNDTDLRQLRKDLSVVSAREAQSVLLEQVRQSRAISHVS
jgi:hypothetical protein